MKPLFDNGDFLQGDQGFFFDLSCADRNDTFSHWLGSMWHRLSNSIANFFYCFDSVLVGNMGVARSGPAPTGTISQRKPTLRRSKRG